MITALQSSIRNPILAGTVGSMALGRLHSEDVSEHLLISGRPWGRGLGSGGLGVARNSLYPAHAVVFLAAPLCVSFSRLLLEAPVIALCELLRAHSPQVAADNQGAPLSRK